MESVFVRSLLFVCILLYGHLVLAQLSVQCDGVDVPNASVGIRILLDSDTAFSDRGLQKVLRRAWQPVRGAAPEISYSTSSAWLMIPFEHIQRRGPFRWLVVENPHINHLRLWVLGGDSVLHTSALTGDAFPFRSRPFTTRNYLFSLDSVPATGGYLVLMADKRQSRLALPLHFQSDPYFVQNHEMDLKGMMFFLGFTFFLLLFNTYLFIYTRDLVFGWYILYLLLILVYLFVDLGFFFKVLYPEWPKLNDIIRPASFALSVVPMLLFFNRIIDIRTHAPRLDTLNKRIAIVFLSLYMVAVASSAITNDAGIQYFWLQSNRVVTPFVLFVLVLESLYFIRKGHFIAVFSFGSIFSLIFFSMVYIGLQYNWLKSTPFTTYSLYWGLSADAFFMGLSLAWRFRYLRKSVEQLVREKTERQMQFALEISTWKEQQMQHTSAFLHDRVGGLMGMLRLSVDNMSLDEKGRREIASEIVSVADEIRQYSHFYSPALLHSQSLKETIAGLMHKIRAKTPIHFQFEWDGPEEIEPEQLKVFLYFCVQEMFQNMLKHSSCSQVIVQVINKPALVSLYFEDDGIGCGDVETTQGYGLKSMKRIVDLLGGNFLVRAVPEEGFYLSVELGKYAS